MNEKINPPPIYGARISRFIESEYSIKSKPAVRESSMELLRIVAMTMIIINHFLLHAIKPENLPGNLFYLLDPLVLIGVNLFFLISGYFQVKLSIKNILKLAFTVFFFGFINLILSYFFTGNISLSRIIKLFLFPISSSPYWFLSVYLVLIIISPMINFFLNNINKKQLISFLLIFTFFMVYSCGIGYNFANNYGYSLLSSIYLYCIGSFFRKYPDFFKTGRSYWLFVVFLVTTFLNCFCSFYTLNSPYFRSYTGVFVLISSFALFLFFTRLEFRNNIINSIATAALGCYLLQDGWFGMGYFYEYLNKLYLEATNLGYIFSVFSAIFVGFWILSWVLTKFERLWSVPLINFIESVLPSKIKDLFQLSV